MSNINNLEGKNPFTKEVLEELTNSNFVTFKCNVCGYELPYFKGFVKYSNISKAMKDHVKKVHEVILT